MEWNCSREEIEAFFFALSLSWKEADLGFDRLSIPPRCWHTLAQAGVSVRNQTPTGVQRLILTIEDLGIKEAESAGVEEAGSICEGECDEVRWEVQMEILAICAVVEYSTY